MIQPNFDKKRYGSAQRRFLQPLVAKFLEKELSSIGPEMSRMLADRIVELMEAVCPEGEHVKPGQIVWMALDEATRGGSKNERLKRVVLTLVNEEEAKNLAASQGVVKVRQAAVARMFKEAYAQGALLSTRDLAMVFHVHDSAVSVLRVAAEKELGQCLPHPGVLHDMGSCITHKVDIVRKAICEGMDPADVARATRHSQRAVDQYLTCFHKVRTLMDYKMDPDMISTVTGMTTRLILEYINIIESIEPHEN